jgi:hypothetical protein
MAIDVCGIVTLLAVFDMSAKFCRLFFPQYLHGLHASGANRRHK